MARCPGCNKFPSLESEAEVDQDLELNDGTISGSVRVVRRSACCGEEIKELVYELEEDITEKLEGHLEDGDHELELDAEDPEVDESGGGRYAKNMIQVTVNYTVKCSCQKDPVHEGSLTHSEAASSFEELV